MNKEITDEEKETINAMAVSDDKYIEEIEKKAKAHVHRYSYGPNPESAQVLQIITTRKLRKAIDTFNSRSSWLAGAMLLLAFIQIVLLIVQIVRM